MNKTFIFATFVLMAVLLAFNASAALTLTNVQLGDNAQERNQNVTKTFTITNPDVAAVTINGITFAGVNGLDVTQYKLIVTAVTGPTGLTVTNGQLSGSLPSLGTATVTLQGFVTKNFNSVDSTTLDEKAFEIATMTVAGATSDTAKVTMQAKNKLVVDDMNVVVNGESQSVSSNERVDNLKPGDKIELEVITKNQFSDRSDVDVEINDVLVKVLSNNLDQLDVDDEEDVGTLSAKSDDSVKFSFTIADDTDDSTYTVTVSTSGVDENGAKHGEKKTVRFKINRETHEIAFKKLQAVPEFVECDGSRVVTVDASVNNIGQRKEDNVAVEATVSQLKFSKKITDLKLDKGKTKTIQFPIDVPATAKAGEYRVDLTTFFENTMKSNTKSVTFSVGECEEEEPVVVTPPVVTTPPVTTPPATITPPAVTTVPKVRVTSESFTSSAMYVYLLAGVSGVMVLLLIVLVVVLASRRRNDDD